MSENNYKQYSLFFSKKKKIQFIKNEKKKTKKLQNFKIQRPKQKIHSLQQFSHSFKRIFKVRCKRQSKMLLVKLVVAAQARPYDL
jgi:hypothetical protein